jgi:spore germination protein GerM
LPATAKAFPAYFYYIQNGTLLQFIQNILRPFTVTEVLKTLEGGPSLTNAAPQQGGPVTTDLPVGSDLRAIGPQNGVVHGVARVGLDTAFYELGTPQAILELGQIVYSLTTSLGKSLGVRSVQFYAPDGSAAPALIASGQVVTGTVDDADYCAELRAGCPTPKRATTTAVQS